jgi:teichuronic acid biosynthesis glycosyltransferase TuaG
MEKQLKCSVVMTVYNAEKYLKDTIDSVLRQTEKNFELIIVNDCSTDSSEDIIKSYADERIRYFKNEINLKVSKTRNFGVSQARAEYVAFIDSDDIWLDNKLEKQLLFMERKNAKICYSGYGFISDDGIMQNRVFNVPEVASFKRLLKQNVITPSASIISKDLLLKYPFYADKVHEDFVAFLQMLKNEKICAYGINDPLILYRLTANSKSRNKVKAMIMTLKSYKEVGLNLFQRVFYLPFYVINGLKKYKGLKDAKNGGYVKKVC